MTWGWFIPPIDGYGIGFTRLPSGKRLQLAIENGSFIVDIAVKHGDFPRLCERLPEGIMPVAGPVLRQEQWQDVPLSASHSRLDMRPRCVGHH